MSIIPPYDETKQRVIDSGKLDSDGFEEKVDEYIKRLPFMAGNRKAVAKLVANDLGVSLKDVSKSANATKLADLKGNTTNQVISGYLLSSWDSSTKAGKPSKRFMLGDESAVLLGVATGNAKESLTSLPNSSRPLAITITDAGTVELKDGAVMITAVFSSAGLEPYSGSNGNLKSLDEMSVLHIGEVSGSKGLKPIKGFVVDVENKRRYAGCPYCYSKLDSDINTMSDCDNCQTPGIKVTELYWVSAVLSDGSGDTVCEFAPRMNFRMDMLGKVVLVFGEYSAKKDVFVGHYFELAKREIAEMIAPQSQSTPAAGDVRGDQLSSQAAPPSSLPAQSVVPRGHTATQSEKTPELAVEGRTIVEVPGVILDDVMQYLAVIGPMNIKVLEKRLSDGYYGDIKFGGIPAQIVEHLEKQGKVRIEDGLIKKAEK